MNLFVLPLFVEGIILAFLTLLFLICSTCIITWYISNEVRKDETMEMGPLANERATENENAEELDDWAV